MKQTKKKSYEIGDKKENGETYKIKFTSIDPIDIDADVIVEYEKVSAIKNRFLVATKKYNDLIKIREEIAVTPVEYLRSGINRILSDYDLRRLIINGCDYELEQIQHEIESIREEWQNGRY